MSRSFDRWMKNQQTKERDRDRKRDAQWAIQKCAEGDITDFPAIKKYALNLREGMSAAYQLIAEKLRMSIPDATKLEVRRAISKSQNSKMKRKKSTTNSSTSAVR